MGKVLVNEEQLEGLIALCEEQQAELAEFKQMETREIDLSGFREGPGLDEEQQAEEKENDLSDVILADDTNSEIDDLINGTNTN